MKIKIHKLPIPEGADVAALNRKISAWADRRNFGIAHSICDGVVNVEFYVELNGVVVDPVLVEKALQNLVRIINRSAPKTIRDCALRVPEMMPRSQHDDTMRALKAILSPPSDGEGYYNERMDKALGLVLAALGDSSKPGSPPMGSTPATRRSKRSA